MMTNLKVADMPALGEPVQAGGRGHDEYLLNEAVDNFAGRYGRVALIEVLHEAAKRHNLMLIAGPQTLATNPENVP